MRKYVLLPDWRLESDFVIKNKASLQHNPASLFLLWEIGRISIKNKARK